MYDFISTVFLGEFTQAKFDDNGRAFGNQMAGDGLLGSVCVLNLTVLTIFTLYERNCFGWW